jgi:hypothetical protein
MAKQLGGINGPYQGKVGKVVGYQWRGQWVVRAAAEEFHDAKSERQLEQRGRFKASVAFAARLRDILVLGLKQSAQKAHKTEYNYFQMINNGCLAWDGENLVVDYPNLKLSEGPVAPVAFTGVVQGNAEESGGGQIITLSFEKNPEHRNCNGNDKVFVAAINASRCEAVLSLPVYRRMGSITLTLPSYWENDEVHLYGFVQDNAGRCSESVYINFMGVIGSEKGVKGSERTNESDEYDENHENNESYGNPGVERNGAGRGGGKGGGGDGN